MPLHRKPQPTKIPADQAAVAQLDSHIANVIAAIDNVRAWFTSNPVFANVAARIKADAQAKARADHFAKVGHKTLGTVSSEAIEDFLKTAPNRTSVDVNNQAMAESTRAQLAYKPTHDKNLADANAAANAVVTPSPQDLAIIAFNKWHGMYASIKDTDPEELSTIFAMISAEIK